MTYRNLKWWLDQMEPDELDRQLTPFLLIDAVDNRMSQSLETFLALVSLFDGEPEVRDEALRLLILLTISIRG